MAALALVSTILMGVFLLAVVAVMARGGQRTTSLRLRPGGERPASAGPAPGEASEGGGGVLQDPMLWILGFALLLATIAGGAIAYAGGLVPEMAPETIGLAVVGLFGSVLAAYFAWGVYHSTRAHDRSSAEAAGVSATVLGLLLLVAIIAKLIIESGG